MGAQEWFMRDIFGCMTPPVKEFDRAISTALVRRGSWEEGKWGVKEVFTVVVRGWVGGTV